MFLTIPKHSTNVSKVMQLEPSLYCFIARGVLYIEKKQRNVIIETLLNVFEIMMTGVASEVIIETALVCQTD